MSYISVNDSKQTPNRNKHALVSTLRKNLKNPNTSEGKDENASNTTESHFKIHAPLDTSVVAVADADTKNQIAATTNGPKVHEFPKKISRLSESDRSVEDGENMKGGSETLDKGVVSVKESMMHKFEHGEDARALSKVTTQAISTRRDKVRVARSSSLKNEESSDQVNSSNVDSNSKLDFKSKSLPTCTNLNTTIGSKTTPIKQSYSLGSNASKACLNLNQTFKSTFASYQDHFLGSSSSNNPILNYSSSTKTNLGSSQCLAHLNSPSKANSTTLGPVASGDYETQAPTKSPVSSAKNTRVPGHKATSVRRVPVSRAYQKRVPIHSETNAVNSVSCI
ncbi:hypothetical protein SSX86_026428 [Deinandra increscens subsp. villosa]|uniref:LTI65/LTI78 PGEED repeat domain-containing protein n=1 Tax=Deinandra increscens subsp. villosa TaxID=3103831 RepID=A0AAP0CEY1_9ASTR